MKRGITSAFTPPPSLSPLEQAIWRTLAYFDVFDYPLTAEEIHRYLEGEPATPRQIVELLGSGNLLAKHLTQSDGYFTMAGRKRIVTLREARALHAQRLWHVARYYGRRVSSLPFVRMVAVTGSLAMANVEDGADIDYLIVTSKDRLWLSRAFVILVVRMAARRGHVLCPNYVLSERALVFPNQNLYTAHELAQMVPLSGMDVYWLMRQLNGWTRVYLPNAQGPPDGGRSLTTQGKRWPWQPWQRMVEMPLRTPVGNWLEQWEMGRKIRKLQHQQGDREEVAFSADWCKGHFDGHKRHTLDAFEARLRRTYQRDDGHPK